MLRKRRKNPKRWQYLHEDSFILRGATRAERLVKLNIELPPKTITGDSANTLLATSGQMNHVACKLLSIIQEKCEFCLLLLLLLLLSLYCEIFRTHY